MNEFSDILIKIQKSEYLSRQDIKFAYNFILDGKANDIEIEDFLIGLNNKGITIDDIICGVEVLREKSFKVEVPLVAKPPTSTELKIEQQQKKQRFD